MTAGRAAPPSRGTGGFAVTALVALASGALFEWIGLPIPWLLGPMIGVWLASRGLQSALPSLRLSWPVSLRNAGLILVGYTIGLSFTSDTVREMASQLPSMALLTLLLLLLSVLIASGIARWAGIPFPTALTGSIPGGLSQMVALAEETKGIDVTVVAFLQVSRLMLIVVCVPLLIFGPIFGGAHAEPWQPLAGESGSGSWTSLFPDVLPYALACTVGALIGKRINFPTAFLLAPLLAAAALHLAGLPGPSLPVQVVDAAQLMIGSHVGLLLKPEKLPNKTRLVALSLAGGVVLIVGACGLSYLMTRLHPVSGSTALLSLAPGGMDQMGIVAHEIGADVPTVTGYQLFRTFFIFFAVPALLRRFFGKLPDTVLRDPPSPKRRG